MNIIKTKNSRDSLYEFLLLLSIKEKYCNPIKAAVFCAKSESPVSVLENLNGFSVFAFGDD